MKAKLISFSGKGGLKKLISVFEGRGNVWKLNSSVFQGRGDVRKLNWSVFEGKGKRGRNNLVYVGEGIFNSLLVLLRCLWLEASRLYSQKVRNDMRNIDTAWQHMLVLFEKVSNVTKGEINRGSWPIKRFNLVYLFTNKTNAQTNKHNKQTKKNQTKRDLLHASLFREKMSKENLIWSPLYKSSRDQALVTSVSARAFLRPLENKST